MHRLTIDYIDLDGKPAQSTFHFGFDQPEIVDMEVEMEGGFQAHIMRIVEADNRKAIVELFKKIILDSVGYREGNRFVKTEEFRTQFSQHPAYGALYMKMLGDSDFAGDFVNGLLPHGINEQVAAMREAPKSTLADLEEMASRPQGAAAVQGAVGAAIASPPPPPSASPVIGPPPSPQPPPAPPAAAGPGDL